MGNHWMPVPSVGPAVKNTRPACELMAMAVGSIGLTAKREPPRYGHWPAPVAGLSPAWSRPVGAADFAAARQRDRPEIRRQGRRAAAGPLVEIGRSRPGLIGGHAGGVAAALPPLQLMLPLSSKCGSDDGEAVVLGLAVEERAGEVGGERARLGGALIKLRDLQVAVAAAQRHLWACRCRRCWCRRRCRCRPKSRDRRRR